MNEPPDENPYAALPEPVATVDEDAATHALGPGARGRFRPLAVMLGVATDIAVFFGIVVIVILATLDPSMLEGDPAVAFEVVFARPPVLAMVFAGLFLGHAGGGFVAGRIAGARPAWHGLAVAVAFTLLVSLLAIGAEDTPVSPIPTWLNAIELVARIPLAILGCRAGVTRKRARARAR